MLGASRTALSTTITPADYAVFVSPSVLSVVSGNGAATTPKASANVVGGVGPFTYLWTIDNPNVTINTETQDETSFSASGYNSEVEAIATVTVTDTGNGDLETQATLTLFFAFGIQP